MTNNRTVEEIEESVELHLKLRNRMLEKVKFSNNPQYRKAVESMKKSHMTDDEYRAYWREHLAKIPPMPPFKGNFTFAEKTMIKKDWCSLLPDMGYRRKHMILGRVVGPLYITISLGTKTFFGAEYKVRYSVHNLAYIKDFIVAGLSLYSNPEVITFHEHKALYPKSVAYLEEHAPILQGPVSLQDIFTAYSKSDSLGHSEAGVPAVIAAWAGEAQKAKEYLDWGYQFIEKDKDSVTQQIEFTINKKKYSETIIRSYIDQYDILQRKLSHELLFKDLWLQYHRDMLDHPEILREIARKQAIKFQLEYAPYQDIVGVLYQEGSLIKVQSGL